MLCMVICQVFVFASRGERREAFVQGLEIQQGYKTRYFEFQISILSLSNLSDFAFIYAESKKQKLEENTETKQVGPTGLDALATMAVLGENGSEHNGSLAGPTTRHPRHRPGCSCIVCIQPPSGKGKHKPNCICNVCATVRRRFKTLMLRKKKRLAEQEIAKSGCEMVQKAPVPVINRTGSSGGLGFGPGPGPEMMVESSNNKGQEWDLNRDPMEEQMMLPEAANTSSIHPEWQNVLARLVPKGTSDVKDGPAHANNKVVGGS
ncbi:hypothetical protein HanOQP8_Chr01g0016471 [Helianthus annuus]|nr:hypothetical protein HanOQP8_Chr01g0016471 [Helianthus annuus]